MYIKNLTLFSAQSGLASFNSDWIPVGGGGLRTGSFTLAWTAVAATAGVFSFEGTDDPNQAGGVVLATPIVHGSPLAVSTSAGQSLIVLTNCPGWLRVRYARSAGGGAGQFFGWATFTE